MALTSLLVCADAKTVQALSRLLVNLEMQVEHCGDPTAALTLFSNQRFDTVLVDCENQEAATEFISQLRFNRSYKDVVVIAMLNSGTMPEKYSERARIPFCTSQFRTTG